MANLAQDGSNIAACRGYAMDGQALSLNHATRIDSNGHTSAVYIDDTWVSVESPMFADHVMAAIEVYEHPWLYDSEGNYIG